MIRIDGSTGEGGGQILRTSLSLAMVSQTPCAIEKIRANRSKPGLMRQHLTAVRAAAEVSGGEVIGAHVGATEIEFRPGTIRGGEFTFSIGTAGSTTLVLQTVLPTLMTASEPSLIIIEGGTHNALAPSVHFLQRAFLPLVERMGPKVNVTLERHGFYPAGGGCIRVEIEPSARLSPVEITQRGEITRRRALATVASLSGTIARRELDVVAERLGWHEDCLQIEQVAGHAGAGNVLGLEIESEHVTEVFTGFGERGIPAEVIADRAARDARAYLASEVPVWKHLADQLLLPMAIAGSGCFRTGKLTPHAETNASVIEQFLDLRVHREQDVSGSTLVRIL